jgi:hypothetical protein
MATRKVGAAEHNIILIIASCAAVPRAGPAASGMVVLPAPHGAASTYGISVAKLEFTGIPILNSCLACLMGVRSHRSEQQKQRSRQVKYTYRQRPNEADTKRKCSRD